MKKILIIEDEQALQRALSDYMAKEGYKIFSAVDGESGFALAKKEKPDLIMLDLILPKMTGLDVLEKIKKDPEIKRISVIILTNIEDAESIGRAMQLGAAAYMLKAAYKLEEVLEKVKKFLK